MTLVLNPKIAWPAWLRKIDWRDPKVWGGPAVVAAGAVAYGLTRWMIGGDVKEGDVCDIQVYRAVLGRRNVADQKIRNAWRYMPYVRAYAPKFGVDPRLLAGLIQTESGWNPQAGSSAGAVGLTQFIPGTAISTFKRLAGENDWPFERLRTNNDPAFERLRSAGVEQWVDRTDPGRSVYLGAALIGQLLRKYGDVTSALAAYNAGGKVLQRPFSEWPSETQSYVNGVPRRAQWFVELDEACRGGLLS